ncbi:MAG: hypothetical protein BV457_07845 [Thermoplasmata archaeon M9B1D]|nr:MAG: hypothetical protein BV457_07845 [Thermoplasmata archaeon M9B1D]
MARNEIEKYVENSIENAPYVTMITALIISHDTYGYTIKTGVDSQGNDILYSGILINADMTTPSVNDTVKVLVQNNQYSNMFILCKLIG